MVNLDDLLNSRPGGIVRVDSQDALMPIPQPALSPAAWQMVEWADQWRERRTGFTRYSQGLKADALSPQTAYGASIIAEKDDARIELIARVAADSVRVLMQKLLRAMARYQDVADQVELFGQWVSIDPRVWDECFDIKVNVGLGVGNKDKRAQTLLQVIGLQQPMIQAGIVAPQGAVVAATKYAEAAGLSDAQELFPPPQPQPPQPNPEQVKLQGQMQIEQMKVQASQQIEQFKAQLQAQVDQNRQESENAQQQARIQAEKELAAFKAQLQAETDLQKARIQQETQLAAARISAESRLDAAQVSAQATLSAQQESATDAAVNS